jgi:molybdate transport system permease protein
MLQLEPLLLSLRLAVVTTSILFLCGVPLAGLLSRMKKWPGMILETILTMPVVLPPTVLGFYLVLLLSPGRFPGSALESLFNIKLAFSFPGIVLACSISSLPYILEPVTNALKQVDPSIVEASYTMGKGKIETFFRILLPLISPSIVSGSVMVFAHTLGSFGLVLMVGGNMPGVSRVISIEIYEKVQLLKYNEAHLYSILLLAASALFIMTVKIARNVQEKRVAR